jgi:hypothetical protein
VFRFRRLLLLLLRTSEQQLAPSLTRGKSSSAPPLRSFSSVRLCAAAARPPPYARACPRRAWLAAGCVSLQRALARLLSAALLARSPTACVAWGCIAAATTLTALPCEPRVLSLCSRAAVRSSADTIRAAQRSRPALSRPDLGAVRLPRSVQLAPQRCAVRLRFCALNARSSRHSARRRAVAPPSRPRLAQRQDVLVGRPGARARGARVPARDTAFKWRFCCGLQAHRHPAAQSKTWHSARDAYW